jgi:catechol 2,3-dioxygenase-like lactoylglutathione lyase family enzyme
MTITGLLLPLSFAAALLLPVDQAESAAGLSFRPLTTLQLLVADLDRSLRFYEDVLGFKVRERRDDLKFAHVATNVPGLELGLNQVASPVPRPAGTVLNFSVRDVEAGRRALEARGVKFAGPTHVIPGKVALAEFADPDGHRLRLAGPPPAESTKE